MEENDPEKILAFVSNQIHQRTTIDAKFQRTLKYNLPKTLKFDLQQLLTIERKPRPLQSH